MNSSHTPLPPSTRIGRRRPSQSQKGPTTLTRSALGAHTREAHAGDAVEGGRMRAQHPPGLHVAAGAEQRQVSVGQCWREAVGIDALVAACP